MPWECEFGFWSHHDVHPWQSPPCLPEVNPWFKNVTEWNPGSEYPFIFIVLTKWQPHNRSPSQNLLPVYAQTDNLGSKGFILLLMSWFTIWQKFWDAAWLKMHQKCYWDVPFDALSLFTPSLSWHPAGTRRNFVECATPSHLLEFAAGIHSTKQCTFIDR